MDVIWMVALVLIIDVEGIGMRVGGFCAWKGVNAEREFAHQVILQCKEVTESEVVGSVVSLAQFEVKNSDSAIHSISRTGTMFV